MDKETIRLIILLLIWLFVICVFAIIDPFSLFFVLLLIILIVAPQFYFDSEKSISLEPKEIQGIPTFFDQVNNTLKLNNKTYNCSFMASGQRTLVITAYKLRWGVKITYTDYEENKILIKNIEV